MEDKLMLDDVMFLRERVFFAARDGMSLTLYALIYEKNTDEIDDLLNSMQVASCRSLWRSKGEAFVHQWMSLG
ncbi:hypothetical protein MSG28_008875 [Choristoneura fumiferana]|uniref:Uncharacterized protein n=1 Tax=Choristoneura fumiferana TaxID=7141 RepID=A0ACC0J8B8_CHOFU|nr:hypothetical protein MSG28_008875 [Choristoneura fumiferana]